jgi:hypothetical protein
MRGVEQQEATWMTRLIYFLAKRRMGLVSPSMKLRAHWPKLLRVTSKMDALLAKPGPVPEKLKELALIKVAALVGCPF